MYGSAAATHKFIPPISHFRFINSPRTTRLTVNFSPSDATADRSPDKSSPSGSIKASLRRSLLKTRQALSPAAWQTQSDRLCDHLLSWSRFQQAKTILIYSSFRQEPDLTALVQQAPDKTWGLPRCVDRSLVWHQWSPQTSLPLQPGAFGILEPHPDSPRLSVEQIDLVLVPAVACDDRGYRLGYGGGFYDRLFATPAWQSKTAIAIVFEFAHVRELPADQWDRSMSGVCTEAGLWLMGHKDRKNGEGGGRE